MEENENENWVCGCCCDNDADSGKTRTVANLELLENLGWQYDPVSDFLVCNECQFN